MYKGSSAISRRSVLEGGAALGLTLGLGPYGAAVAAEDPKAPIPFFSTETYKPVVALINEWIAEFKASGGSEIELTSTGTGVSRGEILIRKFQLREEIGVFELEDSYLEDWARQGLLEPLDDIYEELGKNYFIDQTSFRSSYDGHIYGLPTQLNPAVTYYRTDLFKQRGLKPPTNIDELIEVSKALTVDKQFGIGLALGPNAASTTALFPAINQAGGDYFDRQGNVTFGSPAVRSGLMKYLELLKYTPSGNATWGYNDVLNSYLGGGVAMMHSPASYILTMTRDFPDLVKNTAILDISPFGGPLNGQTAWGRWQELAISKNTKNMSGAKKFLKFLLAQKNRTKWITTTPGLVSPVKAANEDALKVSDYADQYGRLVKPAFAAGEVAVTAIRNMGSVAGGTFKKSPVTCPWAATVWGSAPIDVAMLQSVHSKSATFDEAWGKAVTAMQQASAAWKSKNPDWKPPI